MNINVNKTEDLIDQNNIINEKISNSSPKITLTKKSKSNSKKKKTQKKQTNKSSKVKLKPLDLKNINNEKEIERRYNEINKYEYIYSPRTTFIKEQMEEEKLYNDIGVSFDPVVIKIIKSFFKERLGELTEFEFIKVVKNNLHSWHPELPDRIRTLCNLLIKLFYDIDLNDNKTIEWEEFSNYIIHSGENIFQNKLGYQLKYYAPMKNTIEQCEFTELISYAFYINKLNLVGIVYEGKSQIHFYDGATFKKTNIKIDIKETQSKINKFELNMLNIKAQEFLIKQEEEKKIKNNELLKKKGRRQSLMLNLQYVQTDLNEQNNTQNSPKEKTVLNTQSTIIKKQKNINKVNNNKIKESDENNNSFRRITKKDFYKKLTVLNTCFVDEYNVLFVSSFNNIISAWKYNEQNFKNINHIDESDNSIIIRNSIIYSCPLLSSNLPQSSMDWDPMQKKLYTGQSDGKILIWDIFTSKGKEEDILDFKKAKLKHDLESPKKIENIDESENRFGLGDNIYNKTKKKLLNGKKEKNDGVSCIKVLGKMQMMASGYYNGAVIIWDLMLRDYRKFYDDQNMAVYQIAYDEIKKLIFTCGFSHDIHIYDPYIDGASVNKLVGHNYGVNSIACNENIDEAVSIDIYGNIKIWDLSNLYNYQTLNVSETTNKEEYITNKKISSNQRMLLLAKENKIFTYGERVMLYTKESNSLPDLCDNQTVLGCFYREHKYQFVTVCLKKVKVWNIFNGKILRIFEDVLSNKTSEITSFVCDKFTKKLYVGESTGIISCVDINVGKIIVNYEKHNTEVISLQYDNKNYILISLSLDGEIKIHKEMDLTKIHVLKSITLDFFKIQLINYTEAFSRIIIGSEQGEFRFFDVDYLRLDSFNELMYKGNQVQKKPDLLSSLFVFDDLPLMLVSYDSGNNRFIIIPPNKPNYIVIYEFKNYNEKDGKKYLIKILSCCYDEKNKRLYTADFFGVIDCYSMKNFFDIIKDNKEISLDMIEEFEKSENLMELLFTVEGHKGCIKEIILPNINPSIIITTGNDYRVRLFNAENGKYIDELSQQNEKNKEYPLGIKYYISDPFVSKVLVTKEQKENIIYRKDIKNFKYSKVRDILINMRKNKSIISDYCDKIAEINAQEKLFLMMKNNKIPEGKSSMWKFEPNLEEIKENTKKKYDNKLLDLFKKDDDFLYNNKYDLITSNNYYPLFIRQMDEDELENYSNALNSKIRKMQLTTSKIILKNNDLLKFENEKKNNERKINFETALKYINGNATKKYKSEKLEMLSKENAYKYGIRKTSFKTNEEKFNNYKEDIDRDIKDLVLDLNTKLRPVKLLIGKNNLNNKKNISVKSSLDEGKLPLINKK